MSKIFKVLYDPNTDLYRIGEAPKPKPDTRHDLFIQTDEPMGILYRDLENTDIVYILNPVKEQGLFLNLYQVPYECQKEGSAAVFELARMAGTGFSVPIPTNDILTEEEYERLKNIEVYKPAQALESNVTAGKSLGDRYVNEAGVVRIRVKPDDEEAEVQSFKVGAVGNLAEISVNKMAKDKDGSYFYDWEYEGLINGAGFELVFAKPVEPEEDGEGEI